MQEQDLPVLDVFSPILIQEYLRQMMAAYSINGGDISFGLKFKISPENHQKIKECSTHAPLINLTLNYDDKQEVLTVTANEEFSKSYENKIKQEVALNFEKCNQNRYSKYIQKIY